MLGIFFLIFNIGIFKFPRYILFLFVIISLLWRTDLVLHTSDCPDCFGNELCEAFTNGEIQLHWFSKFLLILHPKLTKSVFFGVLNNTRVVVMKSMTRRAQLKVKYKLLERELFDNIIAENILISDYDMQNVVLCPNIKSLHLLFDNLDENITNLIYSRNMWLDIQISIEPLLLKFLSSVKDMPVPSYCGACGDVIVKEYKGKALTHYYNTDWMTRAYLSVQLLKMADIFTFYHESLIFYFTDISPDNIAVDTTGTIYLTDLDHVIISQRLVNYNGDLPGKDDVHMSADVDPIKLTVSPSDVCKYAISDHNYFAVCKHILLYSEEMDQGLLGYIPSQIHTNHQHLYELLQECGLPKKYDNRIVPGRLLSKGLNNVLSEFRWKENS